MSSQADTYLHAITGKVVASYRREKGLAKIDETNQINAAVIVDIIARLRCLIFPGFFDHAPLDADTFETYAGTILAYLKRHLKEQVARALGYQPSDGRDSIDDAEKIVLAFLDRIPDIRRVLATDVLAAFQGDPSATSQDEIILSYPGLYAIMVNRLAHELYRLNVPLIPRMMTEHAHSLTGIDIHPGAAIGNHFFIDHGTGVVIGETASIGDYVKIYQGVTLGALSTRGGRLLRGARRHPTIERRVTIYSGASILGGATVIGEGTVIGSNAFITRSVPEKTRVSVKNPELQFMQNRQADSTEFVQEEFWDFVI